MKAESIFEKIPGLNMPSLILLAARLGMGTRQGQSQNKKRAPAAPQERYGTFFDEGRRKKRCGPRGVKSFRQLEADPPHCLDDLPRPGLPELPAEIADMYL